jgi:geranylgeranyl transferase type-1 subunit beta
MSMGFFLVNALDILDQLPETHSECHQDWIEWIYSCQVATGGFRGSTATKTPFKSIYDTAHLPATYFALALLLILDDDLRRVDRGAILSALKKAQHSNGSFSPVLIGEERYGEVDVRHVYTACAIRNILSPIKPGEDIDVSATISYIESCKVRTIQSISNRRITTEDMLKVLNWNLMV